MIVRSLPLPPVHDHRVSALAAESMRPIDLLATLFGNHDVVFLGENHGLAQNLAFVIEHRITAQMKDEWVPDVDADDGGPAAGDPTPTVPSAG